MLVTRGIRNDPEETLSINEKVICYMVLKYYEKITGTKKEKKIFECYIFYVIPPFCIRTRALAALVPAEIIRLSSFL